VYRRITQRINGPVFKVISPMFEDMSLIEVLGFIGVVAMVAHVEFCFELSPLFSIGKQAVSSRSRRSV